MLDFSALAKSMAVLQLRAAGRCEGSTHADVVYHAHAVGRPAAELRRYHREKQTCQGVASSKAYELRRRPRERYK
jgi:hypothetical protein